MSYIAPAKDILFAMQNLAGLANISTLRGFEDATLETVEAVLHEAAKLHSEVVVDRRKSKCHRFASKSATAARQEHGAGRISLRFNNLDETKRKCHRLP
jgi:hypothetical protein